MTTHMTEMRELSIDELDLVAGGARVIAALRFIRDAMVAGMAYDAAKAAWNEVKDWDNSGAWATGKIGNPAV